MKLKILFIILAVVITSSVLGVKYAQSAGTVSSISGATIQPLVTCPAINVGTLSSPIYKNLGWCPTTGSNWYFIQDNSVTSSSMVLIDIDYPAKDVPYYLKNNLSLPFCHHGMTGTFNFPTGTITGFSLECDSSQTLPMSNQTLRYILANP